jgi:DNA-binding CsgD family transcriptional regulator
MKHLTQPAPAATDKAQPQKPPFTWREIQVITLSALGASDKMIGFIYGISLHTVRFYFRQLYARFGARSRIELFLRLGIIQINEEMLNATGLSQVVGSGDSVEVQKSGRGTIRHPISRVQSSNRRAKG